MINIQQMRIFQFLLVWSNISVSTGEHPFEA